MIPEIEYYKLASKDLEKLREMIYEMEMSKSQNKKSEQQKDLCITSEQLTDKWKKGELPSGWYWVELKEGTFADGKKSIVLDYFSELTNSFERHPYLVEQVLALASYDEWQAKLEENAQLKEQLKEVNDYLPEFEIPMNILAKIDEALR